MAAQGGRVHGGRRRHRRRKAGDRFTPSCSRGCSPRSTTSSARPATATSTTTRRPRRCPSRARSSRPTSPTPSRCRGTSTCSTSTSTTTTWRRRGERIGQYMDAFGRDGTRITQNLDFEVARSAAVQERQEPVMRSFESEVAEKPAMSSFESEIGETAQMVCQSSIRGHHALVFCASGGGAAGHHPHRLHRGEDGGRAVLRSAPAALRGAQADHDLRSLFTRSGGGHEADGHRGHLPRAAGPRRPRDR